MSAGVDGIEVAEAVGASMLERVALAWAVPFNAKELSSTERTQRIHSGQLD
jgi:hypothetical protein